MNNHKAKMGKDAQKAAQNPQMAKAHKAEMETLKKVIAWLEEGKEVRNGMDHWTNRGRGLHQLVPAADREAGDLPDQPHEEGLRAQEEQVAGEDPRVGQGARRRNHHPLLGRVRVRVARRPRRTKRRSSRRTSEMTTVLPKIVKTAFSTIHLIYFFTAGSDEVKAWCIRKGFKAPQAAGAIHTDFERGFICAEVMAFETLKELGTESEVKAKGKYRQEGKTYTVADGDVIFFKFNVTRQEEVRNPATSAINPTMRTSGGVKQNARTRVSNGENVFVSTPRRKPEPRIRGARAICPSTASATLTRACPDRPPVVARPR